MGAIDFVVGAKGENANEVFATLVAAAKYDHGHGGYSGSIAEKHSFTVVQQTPLPRREAVSLAYRLIEDEDERISDKWGPAGAIPIGTDGQIVSWVFFGWASY